MKKIHTEFNNFFGGKMLVLFALTLMLMFSGCIDGENVVLTPAPTLSGTPSAKPVPSDISVTGPAKEDEKQPSPSEEPEATSTPVPTATSTPTAPPTATPVPHIPAEEMFRESYFAIIKERLQTYTDDVVKDSLVNSEFAKYKTPYNAADYNDYEIKDDKVIFRFAENALTGAEHPAFDVSFDLNEALAFMYYNPDGTVRYTKDIRELDPNAKMIALTYDDGPSPEIEKELIEIYRKHGERATFFMLTEKCGTPENDKSITDLIEAGHEVESHEYSHVYFNQDTLDYKVVWTEVNKANLILADIMGHAPDFVRLPGGCSKDYFINFPLPRVGWAWGALDWENRSLKSGETKEDMYKRKAQETFDNVTGHASDGFIILMHSTYPEAPEATERILTELESRGFLCVTLNELFYYKGITPENGVSYGIVR